MPAATPDFEDDRLHDQEVMAANAATVQKGFWRKVAETLSWLPFSDEVVAAYYCAFDSQTPLKVRGILLAALAYFVMPIDIIPDFLLGIGFTDDLTVLATAFGLIRHHMRDEHRQQARATIAKLRNGEPV